MTGSIKSAIKEGVNPALSRNGIGFGLNHLARIPARMGIACLPAVVYLIRLILPRWLWYSATLAISRFGGWLGPRGVPGAIEILLLRLSRAGLPFPVPCHVTGIDTLTRICGDRPLMFCSVHLPLIQCATPTILALKREPMLVIANAHNHKGYLVTPDGRNLIRANIAEPFVLLKAQSVLERGGIVIGLLDGYGAAPQYSPNLLHLAAMTGAQIIFFFSNLGEDGSIEISFVDPPHPVCTSEAEIRANLCAIRIEARKYRQEKD